MTDNLNDDLDVDLTSLVDALGVSITDIPVPEGVWEAALDAAFTAPEGAGDSSTVPEMDDEPDVPADDAGEIVVDDDSDDADGPDAGDGQADTSHHHGDTATDADDVILDDDPSTDSHETATYHEDAYEHGAYEHDTDHDAGHTDI